MFHVKHNISFLKLCHQKEKKYNILFHVKQRKKKA